MNPNKEIINYTDYRKFLHDYYESCKKGNDHFTFKVIADRAGFASPSFIRMVITGKKNLTGESVLQIARALKLNKRATDYFHQIVFFNQTKQIDEKEQYLKRIDRYRKKNNPELLLPKKYDYLREWLHAVVREAVLLPGFSEDPVKIAEKFVFRAQPEEIRKSLDFLLEHAFLTRDETGRLVQKERTIATFDIPQNDELVYIAKKYHLQILDMVKKSLLEHPREVRSVTTTTLAFSPQTWEQALKRIESLRYELLELAASDQAYDRVCHLNINLIPQVLDAHE